MLNQFSAFSTKENMNKWINLEIYCQRDSLRQRARWFIKFHRVKCFITAVGTELFTASDVWDLVFFCHSHFYFMYCHLGRKSIYVKYCSPLVRPRESSKMLGCRTAPCLQHYPMSWVMHVCIWFKSCFNSALGTSVQKRSQICSPKSVIIVWGWQMCKLSSLEVA